MGVLCPECSGGGRTTRQRSRASFWRVPGTNRPVVTYTLIAINVVVFLLQFLPGVTEALQFSPVYSVADPGYAPAFPYEPWRMITSVFSHGGFLHILFNMYTLWMFGQVLETMLGRGRFLVLYLLSGLAGSLGVMYFDLLLGLAPNPVVGASGAIFGLMGAYVVILRHLGGSSTGLLILLGINLILGFLPGMNWAWQAHVGGLVGGLVLGLIFARTRQRSRQGIQLGLLIAVGALELIAAFAHAPLFVG